MYVKRYEKRIPGKKKIQVCYFQAAGENLLLGKEEEPPVQTGASRSQGIRASSPESGLILAEETFAL